MGRRENDTWQRVPWGGESRRLYLPTDRAHIRDQPDPPDALAPRVERLDADRSMRLGDSGRTVIARGRAPGSPAAWARASTRGGAPSSPRGWWS